MMARSVARTPALPKPKTNEARTATWLISAGTVGWARTTDLLFHSKGSPDCMIQDDLCRDLVSRRLTLFFSYILHLGHCI
jgi:hypothetical protein